MDCLPHILDLQAIMPGESKQLRQNEVPQSSQLFSPRNTFETSLLLDLQTAPQNCSNR